MPNLNHEPTDMLESTTGGGSRVIGTQCAACLQAWPCEVAQLRAEVKQLRAKLDARGPASFPSPSSG